MIEALLSATEFSGPTLLIMIGICFAAGLVRGFAGFALSALVMASAVILLPPVELIPICWVLEFTASILMFRGGFADADKRMVMILFLGSAIGTPLGLWLTTSLPVDTSKLIALLLIVGLAGLQLARLRIPGLATMPGTWITGLLAGIVTGLASIGGMMIALYVLARNAPARVMRASLVMFLFIGAFTSIIYLLLYGVMDQRAAIRGVVLVLPTALGVIVGGRMFIPRLEPFYRPFSLSLLIGLAAVGLIRTAL